MAGLAALGGEDPARGVESGDVLGLGERAHEDHVTARGLGVHGVLRAEHDLALRGARRGGDALCEHRVLDHRVERRVQQRVELLAVDRRDRLGLGQQALLDDVAGKAHRGLRRALGAARLQHVQTAFLDRELRVLHVLVVRLEGAQDVHQRRVRLGHDVAQVGDVLRVAHARDDVLTLRVDEEVARRLGRAVDLVAAERDAGARRVALVAEDHLLDVDRSAPVVGDAVDAPVADRAVARPGVEDRADRLLELISGLLRELLAGLVLEDLAERRGELLQRGDVELGVERDAVLLLGSLDRVLEALAGDVAHHTAEHLHEPPVAVPREALVGGLVDQALHGLVVEAEVEDGVEHAGHRLARAAAHGHEQRVIGIAELLARRLLQPRERLVDLARHPVGGGVVVLHVGDARLRRDREPRWDAVSAQDARHFGDVRALSAKEVAHLP